MIEKADIRLSPEKKDELRKDLDTDMRFQGVANYTFYLSMIGTFVLSTDLAESIQFHQALHTSLLLACASSGMAEVYYDRKSRFHHAFLGRNASLSKTLDEQEDHRKCKNRSYGYLGLAAAAGGPFLHDLAENSGSIGALETGEICALTACVILLYYHFAKEGAYAASKEHVKAFKEQIQSMAIINGDKYAYIEGEPVSSPHDSDHVKESVTLLSEQDKRRKLPTSNGPLLITS